MYSKSITMSHEQATLISRDLLTALKIIYELTPLKLSTSIENAKTKVKTFKLLPDKIVYAGSFKFTKKHAVHIQHSPEYYFRKALSVNNASEYRLDIVYKLVLNNRCFEITLFDDPDDLGYCSMIPDYDPSTYVVCDIVEKRTNGNKKYQMTFGFDLEKKTFLELFEVLHFNAVGILREYPNLNSKLEAELKDTVIL